MSIEGVFAAGISGMGPALSEAGERIVNAKIEARDRMLDDLEMRGLNADALARRHRHDCGHDCTLSRTQASSEDHDAADIASGASTVDDEALVAFVRNRKEQLEEAHTRIRMQESQIEHLRHQIAVQENKILLLREALETLRSKELETS